MMGSLRRFIQEALWRLTPPKKMGLGSIEIEAPNTREAGRLASQEFAHRGHKGIDPFTFDIEPVKDSPRGTCPDRVRQLIKRFAQVKGLSYVEDFDGLDGRGPAAVDGGYPAVSWMPEIGTIYHDPTVLDPEGEGDYGSISIEWLQKLIDTP